MSEYTVYIDASRNDFRALGDLLSHVGRVFEKNTVSLIWLFRTKRITTRHVLSVLKAEDRLKNRDLSIRHAVEAEDYTRISDPAARLLRAYGMAVRIRVSGFSRISGRRNPDRRYGDVTYYCGAFDSDDYVKWLTADTPTQVQPFTDITGMILNRPAQQCRYRSCIGKTIYIDAQCTLGVCPYKTNSVRLNDIRACDDPEALFDTDSMVSLLRRQLQKRENCQSGCAHFVSCRGGCMFDESCAETDVLEIAQSEEVKRFFDDPAAVSNVVFDERMRILSVKSRV